MTVKHELDNAFDPEPPDEGVDPGVASDEVGGGEGGEGGIGELVISHIESCKEPIDIKEEISISQPRYLIRIYVFILANISVL